MVGSRRLTRRNRKFLRINNVVRPGLETDEVSVLETRCNDEVGSLRGSITLAYQLTFGDRQVLTE